MPLGWAEVHVHDVMLLHAMDAVSDSPLESGFAECQQHTSAKQCTVCADCKAAHNAVGWQVLHMEI